MQIDERSFVEELLKHASEQGFPFDRRQASLCHEHILLMVEWNRRLNLTRITSPDQILVKHVLDSILPARWLPGEGYALDVGTGPGFPGIPLKILNPNLKMVLLEAQRKKISFLRAVLAKLALEEIRAVQGRWEDLERANPGLAARQFNLITMRALRLEREHILGLGGLLAPGGILAWWAGPSVQSKNHEGILKSSLDAQGIVFDSEHSYSLPSASELRQLLIWKRKESR